MIATLNSFDTELFLWLNGFHTPWLDSVMLVITNRLTWLPLYAYLLYYLHQNLRKPQYLTIALLLVSVGLADFVTSGVLKPAVQRLRPCHDPTLAGLVHLVGNCGGRYGFASSHAANTFALFTSFLILFGKDNIWTKTLFYWTIIVTFSRIYVGVHYPGDVLAGMVIGFCIPYLLFKIYFTQNQLL